MGGVPFSVDMIPHWNKIEAWKLLADKKIKGRKVKTKFLQRTLKKAHLANQQYSQEEVATNLNLSWKIHKQRKKWQKNYNRRGLKKRPLNVLCEDKALRQASYGL